MARKRFLASVAKTSALATKPWPWVRGTTRIARIEARQRPAAARKRA